MFLLLLLLFTSLSRGAISITWNTVKMYLVRWDLMTSLYKCNGIGSLVRTGPLACLIVFSIMIWIRNYFALVWDIYQSKDSKKWKSEARVKQFMLLLLLFWCLDVNVTPYIYLCFILNQYSVLLQYEILEKLVT